MKKYILIFCLFAFISCKTQKVAQSSTKETTTVQNTEKPLEIVEKPLEIVEKPIEKTENKEELKPTIMELGSNTGFSGSYVKTIRLGVAFQNNSEIKKAMLAFEEFLINFTDENKTKLANSKSYTDKGVSYCFLLNELNGSKQIDFIREAKVALKDFNIVSFNENSECPQK